jgi:hypothetical protein
MLPGRLVTQASPVTYFGPKYSEGETYRLVLILRHYGSVNLIDVERLREAAKKERN